MVGSSILNTSKSSLGAFPICRRFLGTFQIYGANTDVGKTILSGGIVRSALRDKIKVNYIKPVQTGSVIDEEFVKKIQVKDKTDIKSNFELNTLFKYNEPLSPHLAAKLDNVSVTDAQVVESLEKALNQSNQRHNCLTLVETAGGVLSPGPSSNITSQADLYRKFRLPAILVGDPKLGGISTTMSAYESLYCRGYDVAAIVVFGNKENLLAVEKMVENDVGANLTTSYMPKFILGPQLPDESMSDSSLVEWYSIYDGWFNSCMQSIVKQEVGRRNNIKSMPQRTLDMVWWPFTQHQTQKTVTVIDSAFKDDFVVVDEEAMEKNSKENNNPDLQLKNWFDSCASWWTQGLGHGHSGLSRAISYAAGRYGHVIFPENTNQSVLKLSEILLDDIGKGWARRVFYSDNGSTAIEVGIKMAFRKFMVDHKMNVSDSSVGLDVIAQAACYHGDTLGAMNVALPSVFNKQQFSWFTSKAFCIDTPTVNFKNSKVCVDIPFAEDLGLENEHLLGQQYTSLQQVFDIDRDNTELATAYKTFISKAIDSELEARSSNKSVFGALLIEPVVMGAGGMMIVDPLFQRILIQECKLRKIPVVYDEVFSGCWRLGESSARKLLHIDPDIGCYSKLLTGGVVPLSVTMASKDVFDTFLGESKEECLLHGHSYTAHPVGCTAAVYSLNTYPTSPQYDLSKHSMRPFWDENLLKQLSNLDNIKRAFSIGTIVCVELNDPNGGGYSSTVGKETIVKLKSEVNIFARPLGNVIYMMCSPMTPSTDCDDYLDRLHNILK